MKKWLIALGLTSALVTAGCSGDTEESSDSEGQNEETTETEEDNSQDLKKSLMDAQMELTDTFKPHQQKISAYQAAISAEDPDAEAITSAGEEAKTAAGEAAAAASDYTVETELPDETKTKIQEAMPSLQAYYEEVEKALDENIEEADFTAADEKAEEFNEQFGQILTDAGFPAAPDLIGEMS
ncbi:hypothetical protein [Halobacillus litoralis]|uniref:hypothetical protein n=1 Tax=Halobacillus litoralis TaxID=45668 RepID=UPI001CD3E185|nr:hypothetical protein [Halobacillus litoralis]MCA1023247.1 hypothetical protein [Halobacillus litoralis]